MNTTLDKLIDFVVAMKKVNKINWAHNQNYRFYLILVLISTIAMLFLIAFLYKRYLRKRNEIKPVTLVAGGQSSIYPLQNGSVKVVSSQGTVVFTSHKR
jgi:hypothetical protein